MGALGDKREDDVEVVQVSLERMWCARSRELHDMPTTHVLLLLF